MSSGTPCIIYIYIYSGQELQELLTAAGDSALELKMAFNEGKSAVLRFSGTHSRSDSDWTVQGKVLPKLQEYRYLGIKFTTGLDYIVADNKQK
jgi:hypothetical protein